MYISILIIGIFKYIKLVLTQLKGEIGSTIIVGGFNNPLSTMTKFPRTKKIQQKKVMKNITDQMTLTDIWRTFHTRVSEYLHFSCVHSTMSDKVKSDIGPQNKS